jgi:hypothetical protein
VSSLKLEFSTETLEYLRPVLRETKTMEETAEAIIPDRCPDVAQILSTTGTAFLRGKELSEGSASVSAGVSASVLLAPEDRKEPEVVEVYIPLSLRVEQSDLRPGMVAGAQVELRRLDSHMVNPRKVLVRATVAVTLWVWEPVKESHVTGLQEGQAELLTNVVPLQLLTVLGEKQYTLEDTVALYPEGNGQTLVSCQMEITHTDTRLTGTRAVFKGTVQLRVLYLDAEGDLHTGTAEVPFSQYIDLGECQETDHLQLASCLTGADLELGQDGGLNVVLQMLTRAEVWATRELAYLEDLYSLQGETVPTLEKRTYESLLDRQYFGPTAHGSLGLEGTEVIWCSCIPGEVSHLRSGETTEFTLPVTVQVLTGEGTALRGGSTRVNLTFATQASAGCRFGVQPGGISVTATLSGGNVELLLSGTVCVSTFLPTELQEITEAEVTAGTQTGERPGLMIRRIGQDETLWQLAKRYGTTRAAISGANDLEGEPEGSMLLLIPRCTG